MNTFKYGLPRDINGIYNSLTKVPPNTFDELLSRVNKYARVEDDKLAMTRPTDEKKGGNGKFYGSKRKRKENFNKVSEEGYRGVNTVFAKPIHKIMFTSKISHTLNGLDHCKECKVEMLVSQRS